MKHGIETLNAKEQFIVRELLQNKSFSSLTRYNYSKLEQFNKTFDPEFKNSQRYDHIWNRIQETLRDLVEKKIIGFTTSRLNPEISKTGKWMNVRSYELKSYWVSQNSYELTEFKKRCGLINNWRRYSA